MAHFFTSILSLQFDKIYKRMSETSQVNTMLANIYYFNYLFDKVLVITLLPEVRNVVTR